MPEEEEWRRTLSRRSDGIEKLRSKETCFHKPSLAKLIEQGKE